ncbi:MAB_1171c family putative transporter [Nocardia araoensis]|uniref:MAB_1171c family putative transporter n=1 Tax=Nocardia araoensis TaxID=228600 RepID=UPI0002E909AB|nr:MAB_1171c family putative transporter [Nocardia araoensis]
MDSVPAWIIFPVIAAIAAITAGRWFLVADTITDRMINRAWAWNLCGLVLFVAAAAAGWPELGQRLFLCCGLMTTAVVLLLAQLAAGADPDAMPRRQRIYSGVAAMSSMVTLLLSPFTRSVLHVGLDEVVWTLSELPMVASGYLLAQASFRELRTAARTTKEKLTYSVLLFLAVYWAVAAALTVARAVQGVPPSHPGNILAVSSFLCVLTIATLTAIPLFTAISARAGLDRASRRCRRLRPLWCDLTAAVPEVVLSQADGWDNGAASRLYRMTVEIQDALLHLKPYMPSAEQGPETASGPGVGDYARQIAWAVRSRTAGLSPVAQTGRLAAVMGGAHDRANGLRQLLELAREWPKACAEIG